MNVLQVQDLTVSLPRGADRPEAVCGAGILTEAILSFLGVGLPPDIPTWGNVMAEGRAQFNEYPHNIFFPGIFLTLTVLAINLLGDGLRDTLDPKMAKRV